MSEFWMTVCTDQSVLHDDYGYRWRWRADRRARWLNEQRVQVSDFGYPYQWRPVRHNRRWRCVAFQNRLEKVRV